MDTKLLRNFMVIVDCGSLSKASERLHVAQPALSYQMAGLEREFGTRLLLRSSQGVGPTKAGEALYRRAHVILTQMESLHEVVLHGDVPEAGPVALGFPTSTASVLAQPLLALVVARHPAIHLQIFESMSGYVADRVAGGRLDLALLFRDSPTIGIAVQPLLDEEIFLVGNAGLDDLPPGEPCPLSRLERVPLVLPSDAQGLRTLVERSFAKADVALNVLADIDSLPTLVGAARRGLACAVLAKSALASHGGEDGLTIRPLGNPPIKRPVSLCWPTNLPRTAAAMAVHAILVELTRDLVANGTWGGATPRPGGLAAPAP